MGDMRLSDFAGRPLAMEPPGTPAREWAVRVCREAGFEPDVLVTTTDLQVQRRMVESGLAAACSRTWPRAPDGPLSGSFH